MSVRSFLDTNVLVYTDAQDRPAQREKALALFEQCRRDRQGVVSTQVLQEYFVAVTRKLGVEATLARRKTELFGKLHVVTLQVEDVLGGIDLHRLHGFSLWDALILRAALVSGCARLYSENFSHGRKIEGLEIVNPFTNG
jgi:predicted nucleic acid-binding protein